jgi:hypothetical protein
MSTATSGQQEASQGAGDQEYIERVTGLELVATFGTLRPPAPGDAIYGIWIPQSVMVRPQAAKIERTEDGGARLTFYTEKLQVDGAWSIKHKPGTAGANFWRKIFERLGVCDYARVSTPFYNGTFQRVSREVEAAFANADNA